MSKLKTEFAHLENIDLAYTQSGSGKTLLLLHGNSGSKAFFKAHQLEYFTDFHTFAIDSRGHGQSKSVDEDYTISQFSEDVISFCRCMGIGEAYVIGHSDGGNIALFLASKAPELFPRLIAISPNYLVSGTTDTALRVINVMFRLLTLLNRAGFNTRKSLMRMNLMLTDIGISDAELRSIRTNIKFIYAQHDLIKEEHINQLAGLIPNSTLDKINDCNHLSVLNERHAIQIMRDYLLT